MGTNFYNAYYLGVQIGIGRVLAALHSNDAWTSLNFAKQNAAALNSVGIDSDSVTKLMQIGVGGVTTLDDLHQALIEITDKFGSMSWPYGSIYYLGFWMGIAEAQASPEAGLYRRAAAEEALKYAGELTQRGIYVNLHKSTPSCSNEIIRQRRIELGEMFKGILDYGTIPFTSATWQNNWRFCRKCHGLFHSGGDMGVCPVGGGHETPGDDYCLFLVLPPPG